ncbi:hypothetical protein ACHAXR_009376 [Thalassiosira sp. AJA248-18]
MSTPTKRKSSDTATPAKGNALSTQTIEYLRAWMMSPEHVDHPYPNEHEKAKIMEDTGISSKQLTCWFSNNRKRFWKPKMEEMGRHDIVEAAMGNTLSPQTIEYLKAWMVSPEHIQNPYPDEEEKAQLMAATGIEKKQLTCWFSNNRKRFWKPKMDKLRQQYGLSDSDPLPAALLATAAAPIPPPPSGELGVATHADGSGDPYGMAPAEVPVAALPLEEFSSEMLHASIEATVDEIVSEEQPDNKRQKASLDDIVAV